MSQPKGSKSSSASCYVRWKPLGQSTHMIPGSFFHNVAGVVCKELSPRTFEMLSHAISHDRPSAIEGCDILYDHGAPLPYIPEINLN